MKSIYLDYAATTPIDPEVLRAMQPYFGNSPVRIATRSVAGWGNPGSLHSFGQKAMAALDQAREAVARALDLSALDGFRQIVFAGSATEANNLVLRGVTRAAREKKSPRRPRIVVSALEHESVLETCKELREEDGVECMYVNPGKNGIVDPRDVEEALNSRTILVSIMYANNEIGTIQPIRKIANAIAEFKAREQQTSSYPLFHTDAVQAFQFLDCRPETLGVDFLTLSAHKIYGPKGIGALYVRDPKHIKPIITGGGQEFGLRSGTENTSSIVGFGEAARLAMARRQSEAERIKKLCDDFWRGVKKIYPRVQLNGDKDSRLPNNANIYFPGYWANDLLLRLDLAGVAASSGSACRARSPEPSPALLACGMALGRVESSVRFSFGRPTTKQEIKEVLRRMQKIFVRI